MEYKDKIYFLEDVLDEYEKQGGDREAAKALYTYFLDKTMDKISNSDEVVFKIPKLGNLYHTVSSLHNIRRKLENTKKSIEKKENKSLADVNNRLYIVNGKIDKVDSLIKRAIENKVKNIWFFRKRFNPKGMKNG